MNVKELAEFTGKNKSTIGRWILKADNKEIYTKLQNATQYSPADFTIDEVEEILKSGTLSKDAVSILMANARKEENKEISQPSMIQSFAIMAEAFNRLSKISETQDRRICFLEALEEKKDDRLKLPAPKKDPRDEFNQLVRKLSYEKDINIREGYHIVYDEMLYRRMGNISLCAKNRGVRPIDYLEENNLLNSAIAIVIELIGEINV